MSKSKNEAKILRGIADKYFKWVNFRDEKMYSDNRSEAERIIKEGLEEAASAYHLLSTCKEKYGLRTNFPELNDASPHNAMVIIEFLRSGDAAKANREIRFLVKELMGKAKDKFQTINAFHALAKELNRWADELEDEARSSYSEKEDSIILDLDKIFPRKGTYYKKFNKLVSGIPKEGVEIAHSNSVNQIRRLLSKAGYENVAKNLHYKKEEKIMWLDYSPDQIQLLMPKNIK